jgi:type II secretory pathway component GspD/PulD (secretin)
MIAGSCSSTPHAVSSADAGSVMRYHFTTRAVALLRATLVLVPISSMLLVANCPSFCVAEEVLEVNDRDVFDEPEDRRLQFNFREAPWPDVLQQFAAWSGLTLDLTDVPEGTFSYYDNRRRGPSEAIDILNGYLLPRGYVLVRRDRFLAVLKTDNPMLKNLVPTVALDELVERGENELLRVLIPLEDIDPTTAAEEVQQMLGPLGSATASETSQSLLVQGFGRTLRDIVELLGNAKPALVDDKLNFRAFPLRHLPASEAERQIKNLFGITAGAVNVSRSASGRDRWRDRSRRDRDDDDNRREPAVPLLEKVAQNMKVSALTRTNSLLVTATPAGLNLVEEILTSIDMPQGNFSSEIVDDSEPVLRVYRLGDADEGEVARTLDAIYPGVVVNEDRRQDSIHVMATPREHLEVQELISTLDSGGTAGQAVEVFRLRRFNATAMSRLLSGMFENDDRDIQPVIQAEPHTGTVIVRGSESQVAQVRRALAAYGEGDAAASEASDSRFRRMVIGRGSAKSVAREVERVLSVGGALQNPIRVVIPSDSESAPVKAGPEVFDDSPQEPRSTRSDPAQTAPTAVALFDDRNLRRPSTRLDGNSPRQRSESPDVDLQEGQASRRSRAKSRVTIEVQGDELFFYSADTDALEAVEDTIRELVRQMPDRKEWTIFYLRAAEAETAALRLLELLPAEALYPTMDAIDNSLSGPSQPLRIVPEPRTNALFVSGPVSRIAEVERLLEFLDSNEVPESFRERVPRTIPVQYADVNAIADVVRSLYADYLGGSAANRSRNLRNNNDDRQAERRERSRDRDAEDDDDRDDDERRERVDQRRQGGGRSGAARAPEPRLMLAVDERTSELIVSCDKPLFEEIKALVETRDLAARDVPMTITTVPLSSAAAATALEALQGLPNVTVRRIEADVAEPVVRPQQPSRFQTPSQTPSRRFGGQRENFNSRSRSRERSRRGNS